MKHIILLATICFSVSLIHAQTFRWVNTTGGTIADFGFCTKTDASGNVFLAGGFSGTADFDPGAGTYNLTSAGGYDIFIAKYSATGAFVWAKTIGGTQSEVAYTLTVDNMGDVYVGGYFRGTLDFDPGTSTYNLISAGNKDAYILKLNSSGTFTWAMNVGGTLVDECLGITIGPTGSLYATGSFQSTADFEYGVGTTNLTSAGGDDVFILKTDPTGAFVWARSVGGTGNDFGNAIALTPDNSIVYTGVFEGTADLNPDPGISANITSAGLTDVFISKVSPSGTLTWLKSIGWTGFDYGYTIASDPSGNVIYAGGFSSNVDFDPGFGTYSLSSLGGVDIYISKLDISGNFLWAHAMGEASDNTAWGVTTDSDGNVYYTGDFATTVDFAPGPTTYNLTSAGGFDIFVSKLSPTGSHVWSHRLGSGSNDKGRTVHVDASKNVYVSGDFLGTVDFNPGTPVNSKSSVGGTDAFVFKWSQCTNNTGTAVITACNSYTWINGVTYTASNSTATHTLINQGGCDSVVTLNLTINHSNTGIHTVSACNSYTWINGVTYTASNSTATHTLTNAAGCDSVVTLHLTIKNSNTGIHTVSACNSYTWINGVTYTASNSTATHTLTNAAGCDSVVTLHLTIKNSNTGIHTVSACDSYTWINGVTYTASNSTATHTLTNAAGCDSVVTLNLTIKNSSSGIHTVSACDSYTWINGVTYTASNNTATHTLTNAAGCDSVVTLNLTIKNSSSGIHTVSACDSYTWINGVTYTASNNTATHTLTNAAGCDSVVTLNLTINNTNSGTDIITACDSYTWINGVTYTASNNTATQTLTNSAGCDSVVTLNLNINYSNTGTDLITACDSYTWIDGNTYTSSNNTATYTLTNATGCDSVVTLNLTIHYSNSGTDVIEACDWYTWIDGNAYFSSNNTATYTLANSFGCDSVVTLNLTITTVDTSVSISGDTLFATLFPATYQWVDCDNSYLAITGETNDYFVPAITGNYAAVITTNGCTDTSSCYYIIITGSGETTKVSDMILYPNPTSGSVNVYPAEALTGATITVRNGLGQIVPISSANDNASITIDGPSGIYFIEISKRNGETFRYKLVKE